MSAEDELKPKIGDYVYAVAKAGLSSVPVVGGVFSELFSTVFSAPSAKRRDQILTELDRKLNELLSRNKSLTVENLINNDAFLTASLQAYQIAMRTHQQEKLSALMNAAVNSATTSIDENEQQMFLMFIDSFNEWHLKLLIFFNSPLRYMNADSVYTTFGSLNNLILSVFPELRNREEFYKQIITDLSIRGLINFDTSQLKVMTSGIDLNHSRTTQFGHRFIDYTSNHS
jgi:hypothetical protein